MKKAEFKKAIKEEILDILEEASKEDVKAQQDYNAELEKTAELTKGLGLGEGNDTDKFQDDGYVDHKYDDQTIDKYNIPVAPTAVFEDEDEEEADMDKKAKKKKKKGDSISKIASKLQQTSSELKSTAKKWKDAEGSDKEKLKDRLRTLTKIKKELEGLL